MSTQPSDFSHFELASPLERGVAAAGFTTPRPIQAMTIPAALAGRDVLGLAQTGTGKTAAFALPILASLLADRRRGTRALVLAPTRELAMQIDAEIRTLARFTKIRTVTVYGGVSANLQIRELRRQPDVIVACPGRLLDLYGQGHVDLANVEILVLDEADHMFDSGFLPDVKRILAALPETRQNLLFSATMPGPIRQLADRILDRPHVAEVAHMKPPSTIEHAFYTVAPTRKTDLLNHVLGEEGFSSAIVFARTKHRAKKLAVQLSRMGHEAVALQGNMSQAQRDRAMQGFRDGRFEVLVATDIAARGIDVAEVSHVINYDVPNTPDAYTHRVGRTGRSERSGKAYTFICKEDLAQVRAIERRHGSPITRKTIPGFATDHGGGPGPASRASVETAPRRTRAHGPTPRRRNTGGGNTGGGNTGGRNAGGGRRGRRGGGSSRTAVRDS
ncbi:MAG: DEAD/DEAH box helicase [Candidatus Binatia bacterium]